MPAIDLLFDVKPNSERLHQMVLGALLVRTDLLLELGAGALPATPEYEWEPGGGQFDLSVDLEDGSTAWFELKVDGQPRKKQVKRQIEHLEEPEHADDRLYYLLLGLSRFYTRKIESVLAGKEHRVASRVSVLTSDTLLEQLEALPIATTLGGGGGDARSLVSAYRALLTKLELRHAQYDERDPDTWSAREMHGLYHSFTERIATMVDANVKFANNPGGGRMVCWWGGHQVLDDPYVRMYPQWEVALHKESGTDTRLCFKIRVDDERSDVKSRVRDAAWREVRSVAAEDELAVHRPGRFGHGEHMTVAVAAPRPVTQDGINWEEAALCAEGAERIVSRVDLEEALQEP